MSPKLRVLCAALLIAAAAPAQVVCATCANGNGDGNPINDACTKVTVTWQRSDPGDCTFNPNPLCIPHVNCLFSLTVTVFDKGCVPAPTYTSRLCTQKVNGAGMPVGTESCGSAGGFTSPVVVTNYPVPCGTRDSLKFERTMAGNTVTIAQPYAQCSACPSQ